MVRWYRRVMCWILGHHWVNMVCVAPKCLFCDAQKKIKSRSIFNAPHNDKMN